MYKPLKPHQDIFKVAADSNLNVGVTVRADRVDNPSADPTRYSQVFRSGVNERPTPLGDQQQRIAAADTATSLLERERTLKGHTTGQAARILNVTEERYRAMESRTAVAVTGPEKSAIQSYCPGVSWHDALGPNDPSKLAGRF